MALDRPKRIIKALCFQRGSQNARGFRISLYSIVYKWIFDTLVFNTQPEILKSQRTDAFCLEQTLCFENVWFGTRVFDFKTLVFADLRAWRVHTMDWILEGVEANGAYQSRLARPEELQSHHLRGPLGP